MKKWQKVLIQSALVLIILLVGVGIAKALVSFRKPPEKKEKPVAAPLLNASPALCQTMTMNVQGYGPVVPRMQVQVVPQVSGKVIECHEQLVNGGFFRANEPLVVVEQTDYKLAVESAAAAVAQAEVKLEQEKAEADVSRQEWDRLHPGQEPESALVLRGPQIRNAEAQLKAAEAQLDKAKLDLERTSIKMPFDGRVVSTNVDVGQFITTGSVIATVYRTDLVEVTIPLEDSELAWFDIPLSREGAEDRVSTSKVRVSTTFAGRKHTWEGKLVRTEAQIDSRSRMVYVVVQVNDPFETDGNRPPLVPGMYVRVDIQGRTVQDICQVPRYAVRGEKAVWIAKPLEETEQPVNNENPTGEMKKGAELYRLKVQPVEIIRMDRERAYIKQGLAEGDIVILSPLETVTDGMKIRLNMIQPDVSNREGDQ